MQKFNPKTSLAGILARLVYSLSRFRANPATAAQSSALQPYRARWDVINAEEITIQEEISYAQALVDEADDGVDDFCGRFSKAILVITKDDTAHALYTFYFGGKTLSEFCAPKLNLQIKAMKNWVEPLQKSPHPTLLAMAPELVTLLAQADTAMDAKEKARRHNREFRDVGARRQFVDELNGARAAAYGELDKMRFVVPGLTANFADRFFPVESEPDDAEEDTVASVKARIASQEKALAEDRTLLQTLEAQAAQAAQEAEQRRQDEAALAAVQQQREELRQQEEALLEKLRKK